MTRGDLAGELFGEVDDPLGALRWCLADLRRSRADPQLLRGDPVSLAPGSLWLDVWVPGFVALGQLEIAARQQPDLVMPLARRLYQQALRTDLPEFVA
jgi:hypothetical protein